MPPKKANGPVAAAPAAQAGSDEPSFMSADGSAMPGGEGSGRGRKKQSDVGAAGEIQLGIDVRYSILVRMPSLPMYTKLSFRNT